MKRDLCTGVVLRLAVALFLFPILCCDGQPGGLYLSWNEVPDRPWPGRDLWANRVQDWAVSGGRLEAVHDLPMRTAHLLTRRGRPERGEIVARMSTGLIPTEGSAGATSGTGGLEDTGAVGLLLGGGGPDLDPRRAALIHHSGGPGAGRFVGIDQEGRLFLADFSQGNAILARSPAGLRATDSLELTIRVAPEGDEARVFLQARSVSSREPLIELAGGPFPIGSLTGGIALVSHGPEGTGSRGWFGHLRIEGRGVEMLPEGALGPILGAQHTMSRGSLRLSAQLFPVSGPLDGSGPPIPDSVLLEVQDEEGRWVTAQRSPVTVPGYTATFQVDEWPATREVPYRLSFLPGPGRGPGGDAYHGTIRAEPSGTDLVVAAFTGNHNVASPGVDRGTFDWLSHIWFPHEDIAAHVQNHAPDFLFFSGDQVYEGASPTRADFQHPFGDYLYKWYLWLWAFRDLTRDIPSVAIPDDHDVFHGNVWGAGGRPTPPGLSGAEAQDQGGYKLPATFVNMVQRTHAAHLPAPYHPEASVFDIDTYFTDILYGGVSFAVLEDRKFKSPPKLLVPDADVWNGWAQNPDFDAPRQADVPGASLLGEAQERFLEEWAGEWGGGTWMKVVLSQTIFANVATIPSDALSGSVIPSLPIPEPGSWIEGDKLAADMDSNGWPQGARNRAIRAIRKGFAVHLAGDQHLASTIQYGVDEWGDGPFALCVPSVANFWPRRWYPPRPGGNRPPGAPEYAGDFLDGFGNRMTVHAVSNPALWAREPRALHNRAPGYGIARFNRETREVRLEAWPRWADPAAGDPPYPGWPVVFGQEDGFGRTPWGYLPSLEIVGMADPVVQVVSEAGGEIVYTLRIKGSRFTPKVFRPGVYTLRVGEPGTPSMQVFLSQEASLDSNRILSVVF